MKPLRILVTGTGAPGTAGTIYSLRNNPDNREVYIIGTDCKEDVVGGVLCDEFIQIDKATRPNYIYDIETIVRKWKIDVIIPQNTAELRELSRGGYPVIISDSYTITEANNKIRLYENLNNRYIYYIPEYTVKENGFYAKYPEGHGGKGQIKLDQPLVVENLPGTEWTIDCFRHKENFLAIPRKRIETKDSKTWIGQIEKNEQLIEYSREIADIFDLQYCFGFQFKEDSNGQPKLLECNPRVQGGMASSTLAGSNIIWWSVKAFLGEPYEITEPNWGMKFYRYWGMITDNSKI